MSLSARRFEAFRPHEYGTTLQSFCSSRLSERWPKEAANGNLVLFSNRTAAERPIRALTIPKTLYLRSSRAHQEKSLLLDKDLSQESAIR